MDSAGVPLLYPLDSNSSPWGDPLRRGIIAAAGLGQYCMLNSGAIAHPQFGIWCSCLCSGWYRLRFSRDARLESDVFHLC